MTSRISLLIGTILGVPPFVCSPSFRGTKGDLVLVLWLSSLYVFVRHPSQGGSLVYTRQGCTGSREEREVTKQGIDRNQAPTHRGKGYEFVRMGSKAAQAATYIVSLLTSPASRLTMSKSPYCNLKLTQLQSVSGLLFRVLVYLCTRILVVVFLKQLYEYTVIRVHEYTTLESSSHLPYSPPMSHGKFVLLIGPSGVGKSVILQTLREKFPEIHFPKSATTRERREGEGDDLYHFVSEEEFDRLESENELLEWAVVHGGARYGTMAPEIIPPIEEGRVVLREVDVQGFDNIRNHKYFREPDPQYPLESIFILPESKAQLIKHITERAPIEEDELERRIASMEKELTYAKQCDHQIVNVEGKLEETIEEVEKVLFS